MSRKRKQKRRQWRSMMLQAMQDREVLRARVLANQWDAIQWNTGRRIPRRPNLIELERDV